MRFLLALLGELALGDADRRALVALALLFASSHSLDKTRKTLHNMLPPFVAEGLLNGLPYRELYTSRIRVSSAHADERAIICHDISIWRWRCKCS